MRQRKRISHEVKIMRNDRKSMKKLVRISLRQSSSFENKYAMEEYLRQLTLLISSNAVHQVQKKKEIKKIQQGCQKFINNQFNFFIPLISTQQNQIHENFKESNNTQPLRVKGVGKSYASVLKKNKLTKSVHKYHKFAEEDPKLLKIQLQDEFKKKQKYNKLFEALEITKRKNQLDEDKLRDSKVQEVESKKRFLQKKLTDITNNEEVYYDINGKAAKMKRLQQIPKFLQKKKNFLQVTILDKLDKTDFFTKPEFVQIAPNKHRQTDSFLNENLLAEIKTPRNFTMKNTSFMNSLIRIRSTHTPLTDDNKSCRPKNTKKLII